MSIVRRTSLAVMLTALATAVLASACSDSVSPKLTTVTVSLPSATISLLQREQAGVSTLDQHGDSISAGIIVWTSSAPSVATVDATGTVTGVAAGTADIVATIGDATGKQTVTVTAPAGLEVNEVESSGGTPGDWAELYNPTSAAVDLKGWIFKDDNDAHVDTLPAGASIAAGGYYVIEEAAMGFGLGSADSARLYSPFGAKVDAYGWSSHATTTYGRCPDGTGAFTTTTSSTKGARNDCSNPVKINEVESSGGTPGDWIELYNPSPNPVNLSGFLVKDNDDTHHYALPVGTTIAGTSFYVVEEADMGFGLGSADAARLFTPDSVLLDSYTWASHATTTYGRCPDGTGAFATTTASTKGAGNACPGAAPAASPWPGSDNVTTVDDSAVFGGNLSGATYEGAHGTASSVLWAVRNGPSTLYRLTLNGTKWTPDPITAGWSTGKSLRYTDGTGDPDAEGVTFADSGAGGVFVSTERNNDNSAVSRPAILRFNPAATGTVLTATNDWNLTADLPPLGANLGAEGITWIPDSVLVNRGFLDQAAGHAYTPSEYPNHGDGIFFVGIEANGNIYAYALDLTSNNYHRIASFTSGFSAVMGLEFDRELKNFWAVCDDGCGGQADILTIDTSATSATKGQFVVTRTFARPSTMPNFNNEGFAVATQAECVAGFKPSFWTDDSEDGGHSVRRAGVPCVPFP